MKPQDTKRPAAANADRGGPISRAARMRWPLIVVALLLTHAGALLIAVKIAQGDPSMNGNRIDPRYHQRDARGASPDVTSPDVTGPDSAGPAAAGPEVVAR